MALFGNAVGDIAFDELNVALSGHALVKSVLKPDAWKLFRNIDSDYVPAYKAMSNTGLGTEVATGTVGAAEALDIQYGD